MKFILKSGKLNFHIIPVKLLRNKFAEEHEQSYCHFVSQRCHLTSRKVMCKEMYGNCSYNMENKFFLLN